MDTHSSIVEPAIFARITVSLVKRFGSSRFKNLSPIDFYKEGAYYKYTYGATTDYQEAIKIRNKVKEDFEGAFIVAFKNGQKMELSEAISEYKKN